MSSFPSACKTIHVSPSSREHTCDPVGMSQGGCLAHDHGQMLAPQLSLMEMSEVEYMQLIQAHMEVPVVPPDVSDARCHPATAMCKDATVVSPLTATQAIDLSTDNQCLVMPGEKTPASHGEVPGYVMARIGEDSPTEPRTNSITSSQKRARSAARVCLEKRFNTLSDAPRQQDIQPAVLSNFWSILQQSTEAKEAAIHPQMHKWMKTDRANPFEVSSPFVGGAFSPVTNTCEQVIGHIPHMVEPNKHPGLIIPMSFNFCPERVVTKAHDTSDGKSTEKQQLVNTENDVATPAAFRKHGNTHSSQPSKAASAAPDSAGDSGISTRKTARLRMSFIQRRDKHNRKERERRKRISLYCDELNMLVPFCLPETDRATTLLWTTAFLRYIHKMYGDTFKEEFQKTFNHERGRFLEISSSSGQDQIYREMDKILNTPHASSNEPLTTSCNKLAR